MTGPLDPLYILFGVLVFLLIVIIALLLWIVVTNRRWRYVQEADDAVRLRSIQDVKHKADQLAADALSLAAKVKEENAVHREEVLTRINDLFDMVGLQRKQLEQTEHIVRHELGTGSAEPARAKIDAIEKTTQDIQKKLDSV